MKKHILLGTAFMCAFSAFSAFAQNNGANLIIRADDMGSFRSANIACMEGYKNGIETSIEVMVVTPWFPEAARMLRENPGIDVGLHLAITSEWDNIKWRPLTNCPSLVDSNGYFFPMMGKNPNYPGLAITENKWNIDEIEQEFRAQIELALKNIPQISHISGHMGATGFSPEVNALVKRLAKEYNLPLIADLRDIVEQYASDEYISKKFHTFPVLDRLIVKCFKNHLLKNRNKVIESADCVTTVSTWHVETLSKYNKNTRLIYNGYDPELFYPSHPTTKKFILSYTGRILSLGIRDPRPLFEAIERLHNNNLISPETLRMAWYVDSNSEAILKEESEKYNVCQYMDYHPYIPANEIPQLLHNSSILLQIANKCDDNGPKGIMSTKLFEAMATEKPLLCVRSDESCLEETIRKTKTGASARNADEAYDFILEKYEQWKIQGYTSVSPDKEAVERFSRKKQADEFMSIFTELIQKKRNG